MKEKKEYDLRLGDFIRNLMSYSEDFNQKNIAQKIGITPAALNQMLSGVAPFAIERFFQILAILNPSSKQISQLFKLYKYKLIAKRYIQLLRIPKNERTLQEKREFEFIEIWIGYNNEIQIPENVSENSIDELIAYAKKLTQDEAGKGLNILKTVFGDR